MIVGVVLGTSAYHLYHAHCHAHLSRKEADSHTYLPMKSNESTTPTNAKLEETIIYDFPETSQGAGPPGGLGTANQAPSIEDVDPPIANEDPSIANNDPSLMDMGPSITNTASTIDLLEEDEAEGEVDSDQSDEELGILKYANITIHEEDDDPPTEEGGRGPGGSATPPSHAPAQHIMIETAKVEDLEIKYDDTLSISRMLQARSLDKGLERVGVVSPEGKPPDEGVYEEVTQTRLSVVGGAKGEEPASAAAPPQKYDYVSYPDCRLSATLAELRKTQVTPTQDPAKTAKSRTLPLLKTTPTTSNKPTPPKKPMVLKGRGRVSLPGTTPTSDTADKKGEGLVGRGLQGKKGHSQGEIGLTTTKVPGQQKAQQGQSPKVARRPLTPGTEDCEEDEYVLSDLKSRSHDGHVIQERDGYVVTEYERNNPEVGVASGEREAPLYEEVGGKVRISRAGH